MDATTLGAALALMKAMPDNAASSAAAAAASAEAAQEYAEGARTSAVTETVVSETTPTINGTANTRYICGEVSSISITPPASGIVDVIFESGTTAAVLTVPSAVLWPEWFNPESLDTNTTYELSILNGTYGVVATWQ